MTRDGKEGLEQTGLITLWTTVNDRTVNVEECQRKDQIRNP